MKQNTSPSPSYIPSKSQKHTKEVTTTSLRQESLCTKFIKITTSKFKNEKTNKNFSPSFDQKEECQNAMLPPKKSSLFTEERINELRENLLVKAYKKEVLFWSCVVYGKTHLFAKEIEDILRNPALGDEVLWKISTFPEAIHPFAGRKLFGIKTRTRKNAEAGCKLLCAAIESYTRLIENADYAPYTKTRLHEHSIKGAEKTECLEKAIHNEKERESHTNEKTLSSPKNKKVSRGKCSIWKLSCLH